MIIFWNLSWLFWDALLILKKIKFFQESLCQYRIWFSIKLVYWLTFGKDFDLEKYKFEKM